jgi:hypothetical protein
MTGRKLKKGSNEIWDKMEIMVAGNTAKVVTCNKQEEFRRNGKYEYGTKNYPGFMRPNVLPFHISQQHE